MDFEVRTFMLTDLLGSTELWDREPVAMAEALDAHDTLIDDIVRDAAGEMIQSKGEGDSTFSVFTNPVDAAQAARRVVRALATSAWPTTVPLIARVGLDMGAAQRRGTNWYGATVNRTARIRNLAHPGTALVSNAVARALLDVLGDHAELASLGQQRLRGFAAREEVWALVGDGMGAPVLAAERSDGGHGADGAHAWQFVDNLPAPLTPLFGRDDAVEEIAALFTQHGARLVTLTGPGGTGKSRLGLAVARHLQADRTDRACYVELAPLSDPSEVLPAIAAALGLPAGGELDLEQHIASFLRRHEMLLVLDNFEHLLDAWTVPVNLLTKVTGLRMLITSRSPLGVTGEHEYEVLPLAVPRLTPLPPATTLATVPSVQLFVTRARLVRRRFQLTDENARAVAQICHRLDGLPLALELAAPHLRVLTPDELLGRLQSRLMGLGSGPRDSPGRHQTLSNAISWSHETLSERERLLFARLSVFAGDPLIDDVLAVCAEPAEPAEQTSSTMEALDGLARAGLIRVDVEGMGGPRLEMLQTIREFAESELASMGETRARLLRHAEHYAALAARVAPRLLGHDQADAFEQLRAEHAELQSALFWAASDQGSDAVALALVGSLWHYWEICGEVTQVRAIAARVIDRSDHPDAVVLASAVSGLATLCWLQGDYAEATRLHEEARALYQLQRDEVGVAWSDVCLAVQAAMRSDLALATALARQALSNPAIVASPTTHGSAHMVLGVVAWYQGDPATSTRHQEEAFAICRKSGDDWMASKALVNLADMAEAAGDYERAAGLLADALGISRTMHDHVTVVMTVESVAEILHRRGDHSRAARLLGACATFRAEMVLPLDDHETSELAAVVAQVRDATGERIFEQAWNDGCRLPLDDAIDEASAAIEEASVAID